MISFVHTADLHLDSPFAGLADADEDVADLLRDSTFRAFENVVELCLERQVDFLLVAGDVYDGADRSLRAQLAFRDGLKRLARAGIRSFVAHGNHDPLDGWAASLSWPDEVHVFGDDMDTVPFERDGDARALVHGVSFPRRDVTENLARRFEAEGGDVPEIGLLHCNVGTDTGHEPYAPCGLDDLRAAGLDYWALGHVHTPQVLLDEGPVAVYPGNTQGRHANEAGRRGCYVVRLEADGPAEVEFAPVDAVRWVRSGIDIRSLDGEEELVSALEDVVAGAGEGCDGRPCVCRLVLRGRGPLHGHLQRPGYAEDLLDRLRELGRERNPVVWVEKMEDETRPAVDLEERRQAEDILGDLLRLADEYRHDDDRLDELRESLEELYGHTRAGRYLEAPDGDRLLEILEEAETLCVDRLLEEAE